MPPKPVTSLIALAVLAASVAGCASAPQSAADLASDRMETLADQFKDVGEFRVRWNPPPCDCPPYEVLLGDGWHRAFLEPTDQPPVSTLKTRLLEADSEGLLLQPHVQGTLSGSVRRAPNRMPCLVLKVTAVCDGERCPSDEE